MELLDSYLKAVRRYLPRNQRDDIVAELSVELRSQIESREAELGRRLSDTEQMAIFREQGDPMIVARRYRQNSRSLTIGWELIGPELFPMYLIILACNLSIAVLLTLGVLLYIHADPAVGAAPSGLHPDWSRDPDLHDPEPGPAKISATLVLPSG